MKSSRAAIKPAAFAAGWLVLSVVGLAGCSAMPPPVPVIGSPAEIARLEGAWDGEYSSDETLRSGSIAFTLAAGADTAFGDVLMLPRQFTEGRTPGDVQVSERPRPRNLPIRFVLTSRSTIKTCTGGSLNQGVVSSGSSASLSCPRYETRTQT